MIREIEITAKLVRDLLRDQHPDLADHPVRLGARGWDNQLWRLGDDLAVRLPWATESADALLRKEHTWLPALAPRLPLPVPAVAARRGRMCGPPPRNQLDVGRRCRCTGRRRLRDRLVLDRQPASAGPRERATRPVRPGE
ncbi:hypothetical protein [Nocardia sp. NPDC050793]|uniref:hypothetical protein n=1 Tax=Nocardia sp. NPDC050793 TaxID=3155159 RepID=UPI0033F8E5D3